ncbi:MAG: hypothetical protein K0S76_384 [Herbinix sp.]|nr:hypothetical protein [Herbinix sp.]
MAKNKNNNYKAGSSASKNSAGNAGQTKDSVKNTHAQVPDNSPRRSGPGGE